MENINFVGLRIREIRKKKRISQEELANITGINQRTVLRIENGHTVPTLETLAKVASALECDIKDFFESQHLQTREAILSEITKKLNIFSDDDLKKFYLTFKLL